MTFEKALEAMKQGKKVKRNSNEKVEYFIRNDTGEITAFFYDRLNPLSRIALYSCELLADDWEICRESNKEEEPEMAVEKAKKILRAVRTEAICHGMVFEDCSLEEFVAAIDFALEILKKQSEKEKKVSQLAENAQKMLDKKCECNCKIQPAKTIYDDVPVEDIHKFAFDKFIAGLKFGLEIAKDLQKENKNNA